MMDIAVALAPHMYEAMRWENARKAERGRWHLRLRELSLKDRHAAQAAKPKVVIVNHPCHLAGEHKL